MIKYFESADMKKEPEIRNEHLQKLKGKQFKDYNSDIVECVRSM